MSDHEFKIIILGDTTVGKSQLFNQYRNEEHFNDTTPTIGVDIFTKEVKINEKKIKLKIWDTAGQEKFQSISPSYYKG